MENLKSRIENWRDATAVKLAMAPAGVLADHVVVLVAFNKCDSLQALRDVGVRIVGAETLVQLIVSACAELGLKTASAALKRGRSDVDDVSMSRVVFPSCFTPARKWDLAVYKPIKKTGTMRWEYSWRSFQQHKKTLQYIAMSQPSGKPVQPSTVLGHILKGLLYGRSVDLERLMSNMDPISESAWEALEIAAAMLQINVVTSTDKLIQRKEFARHCLDKKFLAHLDDQYGSKSNEQRQQENVWYDRLKIWIAMKRVNVPIKFSNKRQCN